PGQILHHDEKAVVVVVDVEDLDDVGVSQRRGETRLLEEHLDELVVVAEVGVDPLEDDQLLEAADPLLEGEKDLGHATATDAMTDPVRAHLADPEYRRIRSGLQERAWIRG